MVRTDGQTSRDGQDDWMTIQPAASTADRQASIQILDSTSQRKSARLGYHEVEAAQRHTKSLGAGNSERQVIM